jgi:hypothetical protein
LDDQHSDEEPRQEGLEGLERKECQEEGEEQQEARDDESEGSVEQEVAHHDPHTEPEEREAWPSGPEGPVPEASHHEPSPARDWLPSNPSHATQQQQAFSPRSLSQKGRLSKSAKDKPEKTKEKEEKAHSKKEDKKEDKDKERKERDEKEKNKKEEKKGVFGLIASASKRRTEERPEAPRGTEVTLQLKPRPRLPDKEDTPEASEIGALDGTAHPGEDV